MLHNGDGATPVWATEMGWNVNPPDLPDAAVRARHAHAPGALHGARLRARARAIGRGSRSLYVWFWKRADEANRDQDWFWFRLADPDFTLQPVYYALRDEVRAALVCNPLATRSLSERRASSPPGHARPAGRSERCSVRSRTPRRASRSTASGCSRATACPLFVTGINYEGPPIEPGRCGTTASSTSA